MKIKTLILVVVSSILTSCASQYMVSDLPQESISQITIIDPAEEISIIEKGAANRSKYNDTLSLVAKDNVIQGLSDYLSVHCLTEALQLDSATDALVDFQVFQMFGMIQRSRNISKVSIPPSLDSVMLANNIQYALCAMHMGFTRQKGNYGAQVAKGILLGIVTLGTVYTVPVKAGSEMAICIVDGRNKRIVFHNRNYFQDMEPLDKSVTDKQIEKLLKKYFGL